MSPSDVVISTEGTAAAADILTTPTDATPTSAPAPEQQTNRTLTEATTVARAQDGDVAAFTTLVRSYEGELFRLAYRMLTDRGDAQDVVQDSMVLAWRKLPTLADPQAFRAWIYHLTTRQCLNTIRYRRRRPGDLSMDGEVESEPNTTSRTVRSDDPATAAERSAQRTSLGTVLATIPVEQRACWVLREIHGLSYPEIAYAIGIPVSTVRGRIVRARHQLAKGMTAWQ